MRIANADRHTHTRRPSKNWCYRISSPAQPDGTNMLFPTPMSGAPYQLNVLTQYTIVVMRKASTHQG